MKSLVKVRIINWHYFYNVTFDLGQVNFLTGQNAAGKSTLIDAMQVVLLGDTSGRQFNKAASEKSGRTLKGYLKGEVGDEGDGSYKYLRNGRFSSYIVLEWYDDLLDHSFCTGIVFDVYEDNTEEHHFFVLEDKIPENDFCLLQVPMSYNQLSDFFKTNYRQNEYWFAETNAQYQEKIKEVFGGIKDKYFSLFKKAVSFTPITNIEQFLTEYVCDVPNEINVDSMRNNIQQYKRLEIEAESMQTRIAKLTEIHKYFEDYKARKQDLDLAQFLQKRVNYQLSLNQIAIYQKDIETSRNRLTEIETELTGIDSQLKELASLKESLIAQKVNSGSFQLTKDLQNAKKSNEEKINKINEDLAKVRNSFSKYMNDYENSAKKIAILCEAIKNNRIYLNLKKEIYTLLDSSNDMVASVESFREVFKEGSTIDSSALINFRDSMTRFRSDVYEASTNLRGSLSDLIQRHNKSKNQIDQMKSGGKLYDPQLTQVRQELESRLSDFYNKPVKVMIYADLVDIRSAKWSKAIEGFINSQKLNMFVEGEYFETASKILPTILKNHGYYRTGLVDADKLHLSKFSVDENSLAEEILTDHQGAKDYSNFLLGRMIKCENLKEARECGRGITPDCNGYRAFATFTIPESNYRYSLIGRKVSQEVLNVKIQEVKENEGIITVIKTLNDALTQTNSLDAVSANEIESAKAVLEDAETLPGLLASRARLEEELENSGSLEVTSIDAKIEKNDSDTELLNKDKNALLLEKGTITHKVSQLENEKLPNEIKHSNEIQEEISTVFDKEFVDNVGIIKFNEEIAKGKSLVEIREECEQTFLKIQYKIRSQFSSLNELRRDYVVTYKLSYDITKEKNDEFDNELEALRDVKLPKYQAKITDAYNKATKEFKDDFIYKLKTCIETVKGQISEINEALKDSQFGSDSYEFVCTPAPEYREYYDMITDNLLLTSGDEDAYLIKYQDVMNNLFKLIGDVSNAKDQNSILEQNVVKFTDYRTYLMFDMLVKKGEGKAYSLAKNIKKQSGGETQTPFYVSILASFSQLYRIRQSGTIGNCIRLVVFDEAFSKMDATRIIESIKILKNFGLQVILSAPSDKVSDLAKIVDKTLLVNRQKSRSFVDYFEITK